MADLLGVICPSPVAGIKEVQIIQWFVEPGARVEQFDKIVEVQTDKASNEVSRNKWWHSKICLKIWFWDIR